MSHNYYVKCRCGDCSEQWNHAEEELIEAVKQSHVLFLLSKTGWSDMSNLDWHAYLFNGLAQFLANHFDHGGFTVQGEYDSDQPVPVEPIAPPGVYQAACLARAKENVEELERRIKMIKELYQ